MTDRKKSGVITITKRSSKKQMQESLKNEIERLISEGFEMIHRSPKAGADNKLIAFLHPKSTDSLLVELCQEK